MTRAAVLVLASAVLVSAPLSAHDLESVARAWSDGDVAAAAALADSLPADVAETPAGLAWRIRLAGVPDEARRLRSALRADDETPPSMRDAVELDAAWCAWGRSDHQDVRHRLAGLSPDGASTARSVFLSGMARLAVDEPAAADATFGGVAAETPEYAWAAYLRGRVAMAAGEVTQAEAHFRAAENARHPVCTAEVLAARWDNELAADPEAAAGIADDLAARHPGSLALIRLQTIQRRRDALRAPAPEPMEPPPAPAGTVVVEPEQEARFAVQIGAYRTREAALEGLAIHQKSLPKAEMVEARSRDGKVWYKVVVGRHPDRAAAEAALDTIRRDHVSDALIMRLSSSP